MSDSHPKTTPRRHPLAFGSEPPPSLDDVVRMVDETREEMRSNHLAPLHVIGVLTKEVRALRKERK